MPSTQFHMASDVNLGLVRKNLPRLGTSSLSAFGTNICPFQTSCEFPPPLAPTSALGRTSARCSRRGVVAR